MSCFDTSNCKFSWVHSPISSQKRNADAAGRPGHSCPSPLGTKAAAVAGRTRGSPTSRTTRVGSARTTRVASARRVLEFGLKLREAMDAKMLDTHLHTLIGICCFSVSLQILQILMWVVCTLSCQSSQPVAG